jgi:hypothetical protein
VAFGAARAFPIRERYLLGHSDPLKRWPQATRRPSGESSLRNSLAKITPAKPDRSVLAGCRRPHRRPSGSRLPVRYVPREAPALPSALGRLGPARTVTRSITECQTREKDCRATLSDRFSQVVGRLARLEKKLRVTKKTNVGWARSRIAGDEVGQVGGASRMASVSRLTATRRPSSSWTFMSHTAVVLPRCNGIPVAVMYPSRTDRM